MLINVPAGVLELKKKGPYWGGSSSLGKSLRGKDRDKARPLGEKRQLREEDWEGEGR